jgi:hypothetical protein
MTGTMSASRDTHAWRRCGWVVEGPEPRLRSRPGAARTIVMQRLDAAGAPSPAPAAMRSPPPALAPLRAAFAPPVSPPLRLQLPAGVHHP